MKSNTHISIAALAGSLVLSAAATQAQTVQPVPAPTIITTAPYVINTSGYYQLGANLSYDGTGAVAEAVVTINANNVTLDLAGHYITGPANNPSTTLYGIYAYERANVLIQNGIVSRCFYGVFLTGPSATVNTTTNHRNPRLLNMTLTKCYFTGGGIENAVGPEVANSRVTSIGGSVVFPSAYGIELYGCVGARAMNNLVSNVSASNGGSAYGFYYTGFTVGNVINSCLTGVFGATKYKDNLTNDCAIPFSGGTPVGPSNN